MIVTSLLYLINIILGTSKLFIIKYAISKYYLQNEVDMRVLLIFCFINLFKIIFKYLMTVNISKISKNVFKYTISKILSYNIEFFNNNNYNKICKKICKITKIFNKILIKLPSEINFCLSYFIFLSYNNLLKNLLIFSVICVFNYKFLFKKNEQKHIKIEDKVLEVFDNIESVKLNSTEKQECNEISNINVNKLKSMISKQYTKSKIIIFKYCFYLIFMIMTVNNNYSISDIVFLLIYNKIYIDSVIKIVNMVNKIDIFMIYDIYKFKHDCEKITVGDYIKCENIKFDNISFSYGDKLVIDNMSMEIHKNQINIINGPNGIGKSTLIKLLLKLYKPDSGTIYYNDINLQDIPISSIRKNICFVSQYPEIFSGDLWSNVSYGTECDFDNFIEKVKMLNLESLGNWIIKNKNKKIKYMGNNLSGSEKKKIQLSNIICKNCDIIIFDEPTNVIDDNALKWFVQLIINLKEKYNKTIIIITHDNKLTDIGDNIINMSIN